VERGELRSSLGYVRRLMERRFEIVAVSRHQPLPIHRLLFHPELGWPRLAEHALVRRVTSTIEDAVGRVLPQAFWAYLHVRSRKADATARASGARERA
jgi:hypothetical protein